MHLLSILTVVSLASAAPFVELQACPNNTQAWIVYAFDTFTASPGPEGVSLISFEMADPFSGTRTYFSEKFVLQWYCLLSSEICFGSLAVLYVVSEYSTTP